MSKTFGTYTRRCEGCGERTIVGGALHCPDHLVYMKCKACSAPAIQRAAEAHEEAEAFFAAGGKVHLPLLAKLMEL